MAPAACVPVSLCSAYRSAYRVAARCAHADSTLGGAWSTSGVKQRIGIVGQIFAQMTKLFVEAVAGGTMGVWQAGRSPHPSSKAGLSNSGTARPGARDAHGFAGRRGRTDAVGLNPPHTRRVPRHLHSRMYRFRY